MMKWKNYIKIFLFVAQNLAAGAFAPHFFENDEAIEELILISDVEGVLIDDDEDIADIRVINEIKLLLANHPKTTVAFFSEKPVDDNRTLDSWRCPNIALNKVFESAFKEELVDEKISIYGLSGCQKLNQEGRGELLDEYPLETSFVLCSLLIETFLRGIIASGRSEELLIANELQIRLRQLELLDHHQPLHRTPDEFGSIVVDIRNTLDPNFRIICSGASAEINVSCPKWDKSESYKWLQEQLYKSPYLAHIPFEDKNPGIRTVKNDGENFDILFISKSNKGRASKQHILKKISATPKAFVVSLGNSQIDFSIHQYAHLGFHVGLKEMWDNHRLSGCVMVLGKDGKDSQNVEGAIRVLSFLNKVFGKPYSEVVDYRNSREAKSIVPNSRAI